ncbi:MAG: acetate--CoA ligase family protein [Bacteroidota bacterium]
MTTELIDFDVSKFYFYYGPNHYLNCRALVFNLFLDPKGPEIDQYNNVVYKEFPKLAEKKHTTVVDIFTDALMEVLKMDINLFLNNFSITEESDEYVVAVEFLDEYAAEDAVVLVSEWFKAMNENATEEYNFKEKFLNLQGEFNKSILGGPTLYSLFEAGLKRDIPVFFLNEENQFQWGYGRKQLRGRSTTFHTDGIKDTEFTMYKDFVAEFLIMCGFPTPIGRNCYTEEEAIEEAHELGYPVVVKPVAGHKGQGVTTGIESDAEVKVAFNNIIEYAKIHDVNFDGAIVQQQIYGTDHRLLSVEGKFVAALQRIPAYVDGNGKDTIEKLIEVENDKEVRLDNARSPLCKIQIDKDLIDFLALQHLNINSVPKKEQRIFLRRVANISAGGVSINVTDKIHPKNIEMVESIAKFFKVKCLGIDVLAEDISKPWTESNFGIIEINAGPGVFMHLAPSIGSSIDVPGEILMSHFKKTYNARIPIITGNNITKELSDSIQNIIHTHNPECYTGVLLEDGVFFNGSYFFNNSSHEQNIKIILRHPEVDFAIFNHTKEDIYDYGFFHEGTDLVILEEANWAEETMAGMLMSGGKLIRIMPGKIDIEENASVVESVSFETEEQKHKELSKILNKILPELINKYN